MLSYYKIQLPHTSQVDTNSPSPVESISIQIDMDKGFPVGIPITNSSLASSSCLSIPTVIKPLRSNRPCNGEQQHFQIEVESTPCNQIPHWTSQTASNPNQTIINNYDKCQPSVEAFWLPGAKIEPIQIGSWVGSIKSGANVNCANITFCPHGCGTHTECIGHISRSGSSVLDHIPTHIETGIKLSLSFCPYKNFLLKFSPNFDLGTIPTNGQYVDDDMVVGDCDAITIAIITIIQRLQPHISSPILSKFDPIAELKGARLDEILDKIPIEIVQILRQFSNCLIIDTQLPQSMLKSTYTSNPSGSTLLQAQCEVFGRSGKVGSASSSTITTSTTTTRPKIIYNNTNPPYIPSQLMYYLIKIFQPSHILSDLPSLDKEDDGGKVLSHKLHFLTPHSTTSHNNPQATNVDELFNKLEQFYKDGEKENNEQSVQNGSQKGQKNDLQPPQIPQRTNTELCMFPSSTMSNPSQIATLVMCDLRVAPIDSDASPSMPILYPIESILTV